MLFLSKAGIGHACLPFALVRFVSSVRQRLMVRRGWVQMVGAMGSSATQHVSWRNRSGRRGVQPPPHRRNLDEALADARSRAAKLEMAIEVFWRHISGGAQFARGVGASSCPGSGSSRAGEDKFVLFDERACKRAYAASAELV